MLFQINKGVGKSFVFKGLSTTYVFIAIGGIIFCILLYFVLGVFLDTVTCLTIIGTLAVIIIGGDYYLNAHFGEHGIKHARAKRKTREWIRCDKRVKKLIEHQE